MQRNFSVLIVSSLLLVSTSAFASEKGESGSIEQIFLRAKAGPAFYTNLDPVGSSFGVGLDLGFRHSCGMGLTGVVRYDFGGTEYISNGGIGTGSNSYNASTRFLGIAPTYSVTKGAATLSFGIALGAYSITTSSSTSGTSATNELSRSRFAIAPQVQADFALGGTFFLTIGADYIVATGPSPHYGELAPNAGFGFQF